MIYCPGTHQRCGKGDTISGIYGISGINLGALPPGSYFVASHGTAEHSPGGMADVARTAQERGIVFRPRDSGDFARLAFSGLELVSPGVMLVSEWRRPESTEPPPTPAEVGNYGGVARKP